MEILNEYTVAIVMAICLGIGYIIKHSLEFIPNKYIPLIMAVLGVTINIWLNSWAFTPEILLGGIASGLSATGMHQVYKSQQEE